MSDEDIQSIIATGLTKDGCEEVAKKFMGLPPEKQFPILVDAMKEGSEVAINMVRAICVKLCNGAPTNDLIWIAERMIELGEIVRSRR